MTDLRSIAMEWLAEGKAACILGYERAGTTGRLRPFVARTTADADRLDFGHGAVHNLAVYLTRKDLRGRGKIGIVAKGCDIRSINMLIAEQQIARDEILILGHACSGVTPLSGQEWRPENVAPKCRVCQMQTPTGCDAVAGTAEPIPAPNGGGPPLWQQAEEWDAGTRWNFWQAEFEKCLRCYACRQACPLCYCEQCIADKSRPRWIESSAHIRGNTAWNVIRAFHLSGRCTGCNECERACPVDIPLSLLNRKMGMVAREEFGYTSGLSPEAATLVGTWNAKDNNEFFL